jgi:hypothetical protein
MRAGGLMVVILTCAAVTGACGAPVETPQPVPPRELAAGDCGASDDPAVPASPPPEALEGEVDEAELMQDVVGVSLYELGRVAIEDGILYADDAFSISSLSPRAELSVADGRYAVCARVAEYGSADERIAFVEVRLTDEPVNRWELLPAGFGVDGGTGAVAGTSATRGLDALDVPAYVEWGDSLLAELERNEQGGWTWAEASAPGNAGNVVLFSTGFGDGGYPVFAGISDDGETASVLIDFVVLPWEWARRSGEVD